MIGHQEDCAECEQHGDEKGLTAEIDELLLMAPQQYEEGNGPKSVVQVRKGKYGKNGSKYGERSSICDGSTIQRYGSPKSTLQVNEARKGGVPVKLLEQNAWAAAIWRDWATYRSNEATYVLPTEEEEVQHDLKEKFSEMSMSAMNFWLCKFVLKLDKKYKTLFT